MKQFGLIAFFSISCFFVGILSGLYLSRDNLFTYRVVDYFDYWQAGESIWKKLEVFYAERGRWPRDMNEILSEAKLTLGEKQALSEKRYGSPVFDYTEGKLWLLHLPGVFAGVTCWPPSPNATIIKVDSIGNSRFLGSSPNETLGSRLNL